MLVKPEVFPFKNSFIGSHIMKVNWIVVTVVVITLPCVHALGTVLVKLYRYSNSAGLKYDGQCCDGTIPGCPLDQCDHHFHICIGDFNSNSDCTHGQADLTGQDNTNVIDFGSGAVSRFQFDVWNQGGVQVRVNVTDVDSEASQPVDYFIYNFSNAPIGLNQTVAHERKQEISGNRPNQQTKLFFGVSVFCDQHYYGHDCSVKCVGQNGCDGHYSCDDKGKKVCRPGWSGPECTVQINEGEADCRVYNDRPDFGASSWTGTYNCSIQQADPIALNLTKTDGNITVNGYVTFGNIQTLITGTFAHVAKLLVVQTPSNLQFPIKEFFYTSAELNLLLTTPTTFDGSIAFLSDTRRICGVHISRQDVYFGGCSFRGSCIRYGTNRNDYYCCCYIGFTGNNCETRFEGPVLG